MYFIIGIIASALLAFLPASIAERKGKSFGLWYLYGFLLWIVATIHAISLPEIQSRDGDGKTKFERLKEVSNNIKRSVNINSPVIISDYNIVKNSEKVFVQYKVKNISSKEIIALKIQADGYNSFGEKINGNVSIEMIAQDLHINSGEYGITSYIELPDSNIRGLDARILQVCYYDGTNQEIEEHIVPINRNPMHEKYISFAQQENKNALYYMVEEQDYWQCVCGFANSADKCNNCGMMKNYAQKYSKENIDVYFEEDIEKKRQLEEKQKIEEQVQTKKKRIFISVISIVCIAWMIPMAFKWHNQYQIQRTEKEGKEKFIEEIQGSYVYTHKIGDDVFCDNLTVNNDEVKIENLSGTIMDVNVESRTFYVKWDYIDGTTETEKFIVSENSNDLYLTYFNKFSGDSEKYVKD